MSIVEKPKNGWSKFSFDNNALISYIDDMPYNILIEYINAKKENRAFVVDFDAEGYDYTLLSNNLYSLEYILRMDQITIKDLNLELDDFIKELINDIEENFVEWQTFPATYDEEYEYDLQELISQAKKYL